MDDEKAQLRKISNAEWHHGTGSTRHVRKQREKKRQEGITNIETAISTTKTAYTSKYIQSKVYLFNHLETITNHYNSSYTSDRFLNYRGSQKMQEEIVDFFIKGGKKYTTSFEKKNKPSSPKNYAALPETFLERLPILGVGDWSGYLPSTFNKPNMSKIVKSSFKRAEHQGKLLFVLVNERLTSQICSKCFKRNMKNMKVKDDISLHAVLHCQNNSCNMVWNRGINASRNIFHILLSQIEGEPWAILF
ncbi:unnamed protein product [Cunninghamella blakesleeana]